MLSSNMISNHLQGNLNILNIREKQAAIASALYDRFGDELFQFSPILTLFGGESRLETLINEHYALTESSNVRTVQTPRQS